MKTLYPILSLVVLMLFSSLTATGQNLREASFTDEMRATRSNVHMTDRRLQLGERYDATNTTRANTSFLMDYDSLSNNDAAFFWTLNRDFDQPGDLTYALVTFDSLVERGGTAYDYDLHNVLIDSIDIVLSHQNASGQEDTVIISLIELDADGYWTDNIAWSDSLFSSVSLTAAVNSFATLTVAPDYAFCNGRFGVRVDFFGPTTDTLGIIAGFREDTCETTMCASGGPGGIDFSAVVNSSYYGYWNGPNLIDIPTAGGGFIFRDCSGDASYTVGGCEAWFIQDFWFFPYVSISDTPLAAAVTSSSTPDNGTNNGTASVSVSGALGT
ncbi:MAG: hypothetical protein AAF206_26325, partial [Bacteroidota bacterium]